ncbi:MAG: hypothetical protein Q9209_006511 [Squamulea sp. 1 TL-2023]
MPFEVHPAEASDIPDIVAIHQVVWVDDPIVGRLMPNVDPKAKYDYDVDFYKKKFDSRTLTGAVMHKVVDTDTGDCNLSQHGIPEIDVVTSLTNVDGRKLVAFARWKYPYTLTPEQQAQKDKLDLSRSYPPGTNEELYEQFFGRLDTLRQRYLDEAEEYFLHILIVSPAYQRKGLGTMLIREGLAAADRDKVRTYVEASPKGLGLYKKHGWKEVDEIVIDMRPHGGTGIATEKCLIREPGAGIA